MTQVNPTASNAPVRELHDYHRAQLEASAISAEVIAERGYFTATTKTALGDLGFATYQRIVPALVVPVWNVHGEIANYQARPNTPRIDRERGRVVKYETPFDSRMAIDVPPRAHEHLGDPKRRLWITEGAKKADALVTAGEVAVALLGVWNFRGANGKGGKTALADWEAIALNGDRDVYLCFDSDLMTKSGVYKALDRLWGMLESRGAIVRVIYLPSELPA